MIRLYHAEKAVYKASAVNKNGMKQHANTNEIAVNAGAVEKPKPKVNCSPSREQNLWSSINSSTDPVIIFIPYD